MPASRALMASCSASVVPKPANAGRGTPTRSPSWPTVRAKGGFMITRSAEPWSSTNMCSSDEAAAASSPETALRPVPNSEAASTSSMSSSEPIAATAAPSPATSATWDRP